MELQNKVAIVTGGASGLGKAITEILLQNGTKVVVLDINSVLLVAIGLGTFLISTLYFTKDILLNKTALNTSAQQANLIALDVQKEQLD